MTVLESTQELGLADDRAAGPEDTPRLRPRGRGRRRGQGKLPGARIGYVFVLPFFLVFGAFSLYPWLDTAWVSLHDVRLSTYQQQSWVGLANYRELFTSSFFWNAFANTLTIGVISTVPQLVMALGIAHLLNYRLRGRTFFRVAILMPYATSLAAATVIFLELFDSRLGLVNWALHLVHLPEVDWQGSRWPAQVAISTIITWRWTGYNALIYLAGMQSIDADLYDAAAVDGAGKWRQFLHVTLPGLRPTILFTIVVSTIGAAQIFGEPLLYHNGMPDGGTQGQYQTLGLLMYQQGWTNDRLGLASATAWTMFVIILLAVVSNLLVARWRTRGELR
ncbi:sugar ABC transporter permease [Nocardioides mangrovicus]|uniref:Sugar ABC transporter permease n=1 Tax=Nocardioides mangrovicus TaxID=2478913 RepID=A0A3L8P692_9ACTN|nr:sugar ABC transporter permease [Nocardioides mangrovicus]RLV50775.1 sugar ABC transporter permease [Nocardioides mangrovicus]